MDKIYCSKELIDQFLESFSELDCVNVEVSFCFPEFDTPTFVDLLESNLDNLICTTHVGSLCFQELNKEITSLKSEYCRVFIL